jgi:secondary thiamine-phosphate synthase enzyme
VGEFRVFSRSLDFSTKGEIEFFDLSDEARRTVVESGVKNGLVHAFAPHATGILVLTENEPGLLEDLRGFLERIIPRSRDYEHPSNAHAHLRSVLLSPDKTIPVIDGRVEFGTWQSLMFVETDVHPRRRTVIVQVVGAT